MTIRDDGVRLATLHALAAIRGGARTSDAVARAVHRLSASGRGQVAEAVRGVVARRRRIDHALGPEVPIERLDAARWAASRFLDGAPADELRAIDPAVDLQWLGTAEARLAAMPDPRARRATRASLPVWLVERLDAQWGEAGADAFAHAVGSAPPQSIRSAVLGGRDALAARLAEASIHTVPSCWAPDGLRVEPPVHLYGTEAFAAGAFEVQDEASQLVAEVVAPPPGSAVLDACAGAGGKALHLAARLGGRGRVIALDAPGAEAKLVELRRRARRLGLTNLSTRLDHAAIAPCARVLVDAPCTGTGALRRNPDARDRLDPGAVDRLVPLQLELLGRFAEHVAPGGRLVYSTCSVLEAENGEVVAAFLAAQPDFELVPLKEVLGRARAETIGDGVFLRMRPDVHDTDGFFAAVLRRRRR
jgi:16S rRNA (cytosine967-C5)-methyltransferase